MNIFTVSVPTQAVLCQICITCQVYVSYIRYHWFCIVTNPIIFCNILMSVGQPYETFGNKAEDQLTSFPRLSYIICMYNILSHFVYIFHLNCFPRCEYFHCVLPHSRSLISDCTSPQHKRTRKQWKNLNSSVERLYLGAISQN